MSSNLSPEQMEALAQQMPWLFVNPKDYCQEQPVLELTYFVLVLSCLGLFINFCWTTGLVAWSNKLYDSGGGKTQYILFVLLGIADMIWSLAIVFHIIRILPHICDPEYFVTGPLSNIFPTAKGQRFCRESDSQYFVFFIATIFQPCVVVTMALFRYFLTVWETTLKTWQCILGILIMQIPFIILLDRLHHDGSQERLYAIICTWFAEVPSPRYDDTGHDKDTFRWLWLLFVASSILVSGFCYQRVWSHYSSITYSVEKTLNMKLFYLLLTVWCFFTICWIPVGLFLFLTLGNKVDIARDATFHWYVTVFILTQIHSIGDPILICAMGSRYREALLDSMSGALGRFRSSTRIGSSSSFVVGDIGVKSPSILKSQEQNSIQSKRSPLSQSQNDSYSWHVENIRTAKGDSLNMNQTNEIENLQVRIELAEMRGGGEDTDESEVLESDTTPDVMSPLVSIKIPSPKQDIIPPPKVMTPKKASRIQI